MLMLRQVAAGRLPVAFGIGGIAAVAARGCTEGVRGGRHALWRGAARMVNGWACLSDTYDSLFYCQQGKVSEVDGPDPSPSTPIHHPHPQEGGSITAMSRASHPLGPSPPNGAIEVLRGAVCCRRRAADGPEPGRGLAGGIRLG